MLPAYIYNIAGIFFTVFAAYTVTSVGAAVIDDNKLYIFLKAYSLSYKAVN